MSDSTGEASTTIAEHDLRVTFNPPLFLQRQGWILDILRREDVHSVLDIGCGEGGLLEALIQPAWSLPPPFHNVISPYQRDVYIHTLHGLDVSSACIASTNERVMPDEAREKAGKNVNDVYRHTAWTRKQPRWLDTELFLWEGGFELANNGVFGGGLIDAFVATEVIEHLSPELLPLFAPVLLGRYQPRLLILTTPNYTYNERFSPPGDVSPTGHLDPTGRTNRIFRHDDHKFEWTVEEWTTYCTKVAQEFGYSVEIDGIGQAVEPDPWRREEYLGFATQVAVFKRLNIQTRPNVDLNLPNSERKPALHAHYHYKKYLSDTELMQPVSLEEIRKATKELICGNRTGKITLSDVWNDKPTSVLCKGDVAALIRALQDEAERSAWDVGRMQDGWNLQITWREFLPTVPEITESEESQSEVASDAGGSDGFNEEFLQESYSLDEHQVGQCKTEDDKVDAWTTVDAWSSYDASADTGWGQVTSDLAQATNTE